MEESESSTDVAGPTRPDGDPLVVRKLDDGVRVSDAVFEAIEAATMDSAASPRAIDAVDGDALDDLFGPTVDGRSRPGGVVAFALDGLLVYVDCFEEVQVYAADEGTGS